ncbi:MAG: glycosyltransferase [Thermodesulfobacteriota bacterium]
MNDHTKIPGGFVELAGPFDRGFVKHGLAGFAGKVLRMADTGSPEISIVIPTRDAYGKGFFPTLVGQIRAQSVWGRCELLAVKGDTRQGRAINTGVAVSRGRYILTMDDDMTLSGDTVVETLFSAMEAHPDIGMAGGGNVIPEDAPEFVKKAMAQIPRRATPAVSEITDSDMAEHGLLMMRKEVFTAVGGENEVMPRGLDPYLRREFRQKGYRVVVVPGAYYSHLMVDSLKKLTRQFFSNGRQAAYCSRFFPQWIIELAPDHGSKQPGKKPLAFRAARFPLRMARAALAGKWIYLAAEASYGLGFLWGYATAKKG